MKTTGWETIDVAATLEAKERQNEATMGGNAGPFVVPIGAVVAPQSLLPGAQDDFLDDVPDQYLDLYGLSRKK
jgi:hypothetical protein